MADCCCFSLSTLTHMRRMALHAETALVVGDELSAFFNKLAVDLEGVNFTFQSMRIMGNGTG